MKKLYISISLLFTIILSNKAFGQEPLFPNSVVSNDIDFILETDPDAFESLKFIGLDNKEMPSSQSSELFDTNTFVFEASFIDGETLEIWCHSSFLTETAAQEYAAKLCPRLGKLPSIQRNMLDHVVLHNGDAGAFAELEGQFFIIYSDNMDDRISTHDLEETVFHESVHASYQFMYQDDPLWTNAQASDLAFVTEYAEDNPRLEDMAESALFAYTFITQPGRLSPEIESWLIENNPNRIEFFRHIYGTGPSSLMRKEMPLNLSVFPNPVSNQLTIWLDNQHYDELLNIFNEEGELIESFKIQSGKNELSLDKLPAGVYFLSTAGYKPQRIVKL